MKRGDAHLYFIFVILALFWGGSFVAIKEIVGVIPSWSAAAFRLIVATSAIFILFKLGMRKDLSLPKGSYLRVWGTGLVTLGVPFAFLFWGEKYVSAGLAGMINGAVPLFTAFFVWGFPTAEEKNAMSYRTVAGLILGFIGIAWIFAPLLRTPGSLEFLGALAVVCMSILYAWGNILNKRNFNDISNLSLYASVFHQHLASLVFLLAGSLLFSPLPTWSLLTSKTSLIPSILYLGICSTALALTLYFYMIQRWGSVKTSSIAYLIPVFTLILDAAIFGTLPGWNALLGIGFIFLGIFFIRQDAKPASNREITHIARRRFSWMKSKNDRSKKAA